MTERSWDLMSDLQWVATNQVPNITEADLHIWGLSLNLAPGSNDHLWPLLSDDEQERAKRFVRVQDREKFVQVRGSLRRLLGTYLDQAAGELCFDYGDYGKPQLAPFCNLLNLQFNVSHSHEMALIAVTPAAAVGIDLEHVNTQVDYHNISRRFFAEDEHYVLLQQPVKQQCHVFFQLWTRKEACIKAMGGSIAHALDQVTVAQGLQQSPVTITVIEQSSSRLLFVHNLALGKNYLGAVATTQPLQNLRTWRWKTNKPGQ